MSNGVSWEGVGSEEINVVTCAASQPHLKTFYFHVG